MTEQPAAPTIQSSTAERLFAIDALRGFTMAMTMALDHSNYFIAQQHPFGEYWGGKMPVYSNALAAFTRMVGIPGAPAFYFLMGVSMMLMAQSRLRKGWSKQRLIRYFVLRGLLLMALQFVVANPAWSIVAGEKTSAIYFGALYGLGGAMIIGSLLIWLKPWHLILLTVMLFVGTEIYLPGPQAWREAFNPLERLLLVPGGGSVIWVSFPILPWLAFVTLGMAFGFGITHDAKRTFRWTIPTGIAMIAAFAVVRYLDGFGNLRPIQGDSLVDFFNLVKYPPSIVLCLLAMGANFIFLGLLYLSPGWFRRLSQPIIVFGQTPLQFYLVHLYLYGLIGLLVAPQGASLPTTYFWWIAGLIILYPVCYWYRKFKYRQPAESLWRLF